MELLGLARSSAYYEPVGESEQNLELMRLMDKQHLRTPCYGSRDMTEWLKRARSILRLKLPQRLVGIPVETPEE